jgi:amidase
MTDAPPPFADMVEIAAKLARARSFGSRCDGRPSRPYRAAGGASPCLAHLDPDAARRQARIADDRLATGQGGPIEGVPVAVKDLFHTADMPTAGA